MEVDNGATNAYDTNEFPEALNSGPPMPRNTVTLVTQPAAYSPSRPQNGVANETLA